ncbi:MAG: hypothetical protein LBN06_04635 [Prevotellaceae bacterium]|jgi:hypothetical protein|nr:hypothetical protein [Prevotellaceae bacterium]
MKKIVFFLLLILVVCGCTPCVPNNSATEHYRIWIYNNGNSDIYAESSYNYPDTAYHPLISTLTSNQDFNKICAQQANYLSMRDRWELIYDVNVHSDTLMIIITDAKLIEEGEYRYYDVQPYMILQRYYLSLEDLYFADWNIHYPPSASMRNMKMYPPYSSHHPEQY